MTSRRSPSSPSWPIGMTTTRCRGRFPMCTTTWRGGMRFPMNTRCFPAHTTAGITLPPTARSRRRNLKISLLTGAQIIRQVRQALFPLKTAWRCLGMKARQRTSLVYLRREPMMWRCVSVIRFGIKMASTFRLTERHRISRKAACGGRTGGLPSGRRLQREYRFRRGRIPSKYPWT